MKLSTSVALIMFNRPDHVWAVFKTIAQAKPKRLLIVADGPRFPEEEQKCLEARSIIERVDWDCDVLTNVTDQNLGCRRRIVSGLNWVFSIVEEAIILEDDCVPHQSFFRYCETLLDYYRHDERVMEISGCNYRMGRIGDEHSYYFSKYYHTLGWATWRRAWKFYDENITAWPELRRSATWSAFFDDRREERYWTGIYDQIAEGGLKTSWDYQWQLARWCQNGLAAVPAVNLVSNIGFGPEATNTTSEHDFRSRLPVHEIGEIHHPPSVSRNKEADRYRFNVVELLRPGLLWKIGNRIRRFAKTISRRHS
jgi:hypothetical protein